MTILFMGTPDFAVPSLEALIAAGHTICGVFTQPDRPKNRGMKLQAPPVKRIALAHDIPVFQPVTLKDGTALEEIRQLPSVKKYGDDVKVSMYMYDRPSWTGEVYETECYFPTWINKENAAHVQALVDAHHALYGEERIGPDGAMHLRHRPLIDKWTFSTNGVAIQGRYGIPCVGFGPGAESQAHAPNEITWKQDLVTCAALYAAVPGLYKEENKTADVSQFRAGKTNNDIQ